MKDQMLGSGQWYESSYDAVAHKKHGKCECWICEKQIYSILLWSRGKAFFLSPVFSDDQAQKVRFEIDTIPDEQGLGFVNGTNLEEKVPLIASTFTGWRYRKMIPLHEFT